MPKNTFRLFVVSLHDGQGKEAHLFPEAQPRPLRGEPEEGKKRAPRIVLDPVDYRDELVDDVAAWTGPHLLGPKVVEDDEDEVAAFKGHVVRWIDADHQPGLVRMKFEAGPVTEEGVLIDLAGVSPDLDLSKDVRATLHPYRACLITRDKWQYGILAVEARGARCPRDQLVRALTEASAGRREGDVGWRLRIRDGVAQKAAVVKYIDDANIAAVSFIEYGYGTDRGKKPPQRKRLRVDEVTTGFDQIKSTVKKWVLSQWSGGGAAAASDLLDLVVTEEVSIPFNDVAVEFDDLQQTRTFKPSSDYNRFGYFLGKDIVADSVFWSTVKEEADKIIEEVQQLVPDDDEAA